MVVCLVFNSLFSILRRATLALPPLARISSTAQRNSCLSRLLLAHHTFLWALPAGRGSQGGVIPPLLREQLQPICTLSAAVTAVGALFVFPPGLRFSGSPFCRSVHKRGAELGRWCLRSRCDQRQPSGSRRILRSRCPPTTSCGRDSSACWTRFTALRGAGPNTARVSELLLLQVWK